MVTGVTSVLVLVTGTPFKVSFVVTLPTVVGVVVPGTWVGKVSTTAQIEDIIVKLDELKEVHPLAEAVTV